LYFLFVSNKKIQKKKNHHFFTAKIKIEKKKVKFILDLKTTTSFLQALGVLLNEKISSICKHNHFVELFIFEPHFLFLLEESTTFSKGFHGVKSEIFIEEEMQKLISKVIKLTFFFRAFSII
jgi:hypothetical protein